MTRRIRKQALFVVVLASVATGAQAHHPGGMGNTGGAGPINTLSASTLEAGASVAGISFVYTDYSRLSDRTLIEATEAGIEDVHGLGTIESYALNYAYGFTRDLTIGFRLPYQKRTGIKAAEEEPGSTEVEAEDHGGSDGVGDLSLFGQYRFLNDAAGGNEAAVILGLKTPTGETGRRSPHGELLDAEFQPGSGSWDPLFGLAVTHRSGPWSFDANVLYNLVTEGTQRTDLGDQVLYNLAVSYRLSAARGHSPMFAGGPGHDHNGDGQAHAGHAHEAAGAAGPALDLVLELNGEWHDKQEAGGETDLNSGGHTLYVSPGLRLSVDTWASYVSLGIPVVADMNGIQSEPEWRLVGGMSVGF